MSTRMHPRSGPVSAATRGKRVFSTREYKTYGFDGRVPVSSCGYLILMTVTSSQIRPGPNPRTNLYRERRLNMRARFEGSARKAWLSG